MDGAGWPIAVQQAIEARYGRPSAIEPLRGLSRSQVWRVSFADLRLVVKAAHGGAELRFYQEIAPHLRAQGVAIPRLEWADAASDPAWLALEHIPAPLPHERWRADPDALALLGRLHRAALPPAVGPLFAPAWTDAMTDAALSLLSAAHAARAQPLLDALRAQSQALFEPLCWISGDPNPLNWGLRADGTVVLYDWERFGRGTAALDLAITVPGLGDWPLYERVASEYLRALGNERADAPAKAALARQIAQAKVWNVVEFLSMVAAGDVAQPSGPPALAQRIPAWLDALGARLG